jgi:hypothetical protein
MRYSNDSASMLPQLTLYTEATITCRLVIPLLYAAFRQIVPSQILFSITSGFVASVMNERVIIFCTVIYISLYSI